MASDGGEATVRLADAMFPLPPSMELTAVKLFFTPSVTAMTSRLSVQDAPTTRVAPVSITPVEPGAAVVAPKHDPVKPLGLAIIKPTGRLSTKPTPVKATATFGFVMV